MTRLVWVDVFALERPLTGNPLAVVLDADGWNDDRMQALARELNLSETTFVTAATEPDTSVRVRIFTPVTELPLAGHPIVGTAWVLNATGAIAERGSFETGAGTIPVRVGGDVATMTQARPTAGPLVDPQPVARACGMEAASAPAAQVWSTALPQLMVPVATAEHLAAARPDPAALAELAERDGYVGVSFYALEGSSEGRLQARVRHFAPGAGVLEDPATGSAAGALGACLAAAGMGANETLELAVSQGVEMGRPSEIAVRVSAPGGVPSRVQVGGRVVPVLQAVLSPGVAPASRG